MSYIEIIVGILAGIGLVGIIVLAFMGKSIAEVLPLESLLVGYLVGKKQDAIVSAFKK